MKHSNRKNAYFRVGTVILTTLIMVCGLRITAEAKMNLETDAAVSGISVALNNYYARTMKPEEALAESVQMVANETIVVNNDKSKEKKTNHAVQKLVQEVTPTEEKIVKEGEGGLTWGTVKGTASLRLRDKANADAKTLTLLAEGEHYIVTGQEGQFLKIQVDDDLEGYVFKDYVDTSISYDDELAKQKESMAAEAEAAKKEAAEALKKLEEAKKAESNASEETKAKESTKAETEKATEATTKSTETETIDTKPETKGETKAETKAETKKSTETVEELDWDDEDNEEDTIEDPNFSEETEKVEKVTIEETEEIEEVEAPAAVIKNSDASGPGGVTDATRTAMVAYAKQFLGNPYVFGGTSLTNGCDCSGFTQAIYEYFGMSIGRSSRDQALKGSTIDAGSAQPGDLFFYDSNGTINHVAMYIGGGQVIHSSSTATGIKISNAYYRTPCKVCTFF